MTWWWEDTFFEVEVILFEPKAYTTLLIIIHRCVGDLDGGKCVIHAMDINAERSIFHVRFREENDAMMFKLMI